MASIKERFVIAHLRHIAGRQHPLVHQRKRGNLHGKQFPTRFISAGDLQGRPRLVVSMPTRRTLFGKQAKSSESLLNLRGLGKWLFWAKNRLPAVP